MRKSSKTALGGIIAALSLVLMLVSNFIPFLTYALPAVAGAVLMIMVIEINRRWAFCSYVAVSLLSLMILADKETAMMYVAFFGYYPIAKNIFESHLPAFWEKLCKFLLFNIAVVVAYAIIIYVFNLPIDELEEYGKWAVPVLLLMGNIIFVLYDYLLTKLVTIYLKLWRRRFRGIFK